MRQNLLLSLTACFCLAACADHNGSMNAVGNGPQNPVNEPDSGAWNPTERGTSAPSNTTTPNGDPLPNGPGNGATGSAGATGSTGSNPGTGGGSEGPGTPTGGPEGGGTGGGEPVPEPGTLLLVGAGLAGAALLRRRRHRTA